MICEECVQANVGDLLKCSHILFLGTNAVKAKNELINKYLEAGGDARLSIIGHDSMLNKEDVGKYHEVLQWNNDYTNDMIELIYGKMKDNMPDAFVFYSSNPVCDKICNVLSIGEKLGSTGKCGIYSYDAEGFIHNYINIPKLRASYNAYLALAGLINEVLRMKSI